MPRPLLILLSLLLLFAGCKESEETIIEVAKAEEVKVEVEQVEPEEEPPLDGVQFSLDPTAVNYCNGASAKSVNLFLWNNEPSPPSSHQSPLPQAGQAQRHSALEDQT